LSELPWDLLVSLSATTVDYTVFMGVLKSLGRSLARIRVVMVHQVPSESAFFGSRTAKTFETVVWVSRILYPDARKGEPNLTGTKPGRIQENTVMILLLRDRGLQSKVGIP